MSVLRPAHALERVSLIELELLIRENRVMVNQSIDQGRLCFAAMDPEKQRKIARKGGRSSSGNFAGDRERAVAAGRTVGLRSRRRIVEPSQPDAS